MTWLFAGAIAMLLARPIPRQRRGWQPELLTACATALVAGITATALDFGGWSEPDWRAATFAFLVAFAAIALLRLGNPS